MQGRRGLNELIALAATKPRPFDKLICASTDRLSASITVVVPPERAEPAVYIGDKSVFMFRTSRAE